MIEKSTKILKHLSILAIILSGFTLAVGVESLIGIQKDYAFLIPGVIFKRACFHTINLGASAYTGYLYLGIKQLISQYKGAKWWALIIVLFLVIEYQIAFRFMGIGNIIISITAVFVALWMLHMPERDYNEVLLERVYFWIGVIHCIALMNMIILRYGCHISYTNFSSVGIVFIYITSIFLIVKNQESIECMPGAFNKGVQDKLQYVKRHNLRFIGVFIMSIMCIGILKNKFQIFLVFIGVKLYGFISGLNLHQDTYNQRVPRSIGGTQGHSGKPELGIAFMGVLGVVLSIILILVILRLLTPLLAYIWKENNRGSHSIVTNEKAYTDIIEIIIDKKSREKSVDSTLKEWKKKYATLQKQENDKQKVKESYRLCIKWFKLKGILFLEGQTEIEKAKLVKNKTSIENIDEETYCYNNIIYGKKHIENEDIEKLLNLLRRMKENLNK